MFKLTLFVLHPVMLTAYITAGTVGAVLWKKFPVYALLAAVIVLVAFALLLAWENYKNLPRVEESAFDRAYK